MGVSDDRETVRQMDPRYGAWEGKVKTTLIQVRQLGFHTPCNSPVYTNIIFHIERVSFGDSR